MASTQKQTTDKLRAAWTKELMHFISTHDTDVCQITAGSFMFPVVDTDGEDRWVKVSIVIPKSATEEDGTDGYSLAKEYDLKCEAAAARKLKKEQESAARKAKSEKNS